MMLGVRGGLTALTGLSILAASIIPACGGGPEVSPDLGTGGNSSSGTNSASGGNDSGNGGNFLTTGNGGNTGEGGDSACAAVSQEADLVSRPVDIIFVIDNSGSMGDEIEEVEEQINQNFATIINAANPPIDYRVVMVSEFGPFNGPESICISAPLGGIPDNNMDGHCDSIPGQPVETANFFHHSIPIGSHNALCQFLDYYALADQYGLHPQGFKDVLRPEAFKFITVITDDGVICDNFNDANSVAGGNQVATQFDQALLASDPTQFGTAMDRNYTFWSIISQQEYMTSAMDPLGEPVPSTEPITSAECDPNLNPNQSGGNPVDPGTGYQGLSILTDGYRYPTCALDYTDIFTLMAQGVIDGAQVSCEFEIPEPPPGEELDLDTVEVVYSSGGVEQATYTQVADATACTPTSFYIDSGTITLCPGACSVVQADEDAKIDLRFDCKQIVE